MRPLHIAIVFGLCLLVVLAVLVWTSVKLLRLDASQQEAQRQALLEENVRLALWRMDSALAALVAQESVRPIVEYQSANDRAVPYVVAHLQIDAHGQLTAPRVSNSTDKDSHQQEAAVSELAALVAVHKLADRLPSPAITLVDVDALAAETTPEPPAIKLSQQSRGMTEFRKRAQYVQSNSVMTQSATQLEGRSVASADFRGGIMTPVWLDGRLLLARRVSLRGQNDLQICWLDWPAIESWLMSLIRDLLPKAHLMPAPDDVDDQPSRRLAALPVALDTGNHPAAGDPGWSPLAWSLIVAWVCVSLAALAVAVLLSGVVSLSERRAAFVSAVTHELRTPLTTFRMYTEMLAENMLPSEADRRAYLDTLRMEADRLTHLVENVLSYARLERGRTAGAREMVSVGALLDRMEGRLSARARQANMELVIEMGDDVRLQTLVTDVGSVEQILFNLVDNACKYAASSSDRRIHLVANVADGQVRLRVADHGPGISPAVARRLFRPFTKSADDAARSAPGVGLGLALSRRLTRQLGGRLDLEKNPEYGGCFVLSLPRLTLP